MKKEDLRSEEFRKMYEDIVKIGDIEFMFEFGYAIGRYEMMREIREWKEREIKEESRVKE